jgi:hypothetical protein
MSTCRSQPAPASRSGWCPRRDSAQRRAPCWKRPSWTRARHPLRWSARRRARKHAMQTWTWWVRRRSGWDAEAAAVRIRAAGAATVDGAAAVTAATIAQQEAERNGNGNGERENANGTQQVSEDVSRGEVAGLGREGPCLLLEPADWFVAPASSTGNTSSDERTPSCRRGEANGGAKAGGWVQQKPVWKCMSDQLERRQLEGSFAIFLGDFVGERGRD